MTNDDQLKAAIPKRTFTRRGRTMEDFRYDEKQAKWWDITTGELLSAQSVDGSIPRAMWPVGSNGKPASPARTINNVDTGLTVEGSTWWPGMPQLIENVFVSDRGAMPLKGALSYNAYIPPPPIIQTNIDPSPWIRHVEMLYRAQEAEWFFDWAAHTIQRPDEKVNHGIVMAGGQGIGKDTALAPIRYGVGEWNTAEVGPDDVMSAYNPYIKSVLLVINEVRPHEQEFRASNFYNIMKPLLTSPPEMLAMNMKYANTIYVRNLCHVVLTTNELLSMYIPEDDRRLFVMSSNARRQEPQYFTDLYNWLNNGGVDAVVNWLANRDISMFDPTEPPPTTVGKEQAVLSAKQVRRTGVDDAVEDYIEEAGQPDVIFPIDLINHVNEHHFDDARDMIGKIKAKNFHFKMAERGYHLVRPENAQQFKRGGFRARSAYVSSAIEREDWGYAVDRELTARSERSGE